MAASTGRYLGIVTGIVLFLALNGFIDHDWVATMAERDIMTAHGIHGSEKNGSPGSARERGDFAAPDPMTAEELPSDSLQRPPLGWTRDEAIGDTDSEGSTAVLTPVQGVIRRLMVSPGEEVGPGSELAIVEDDTYLAIGRAAAAQAAEAGAEAACWESIANLPMTRCAQAASFPGWGAVDFIRAMNSLAVARRDRWNAEAGLFTAAARARVITSPVSGKVGRVYASAGQNLSRRDMIMELGPMTTDSAVESRK